MRRPPRSRARRRPSARPSRPACSATSAASAACSSPTSRSCASPSSSASTDGVGTKLKVAIEMGRHDTCGARPRQPLRQRHPGPGRAAALLSRLHRDRQGRAGRDRERDRGNRARLPRERDGAARRRDGGDAGLLRGGRIRRRGHDRRRRGARTASSTARGSRPATSPSGCPRVGLQTNGYTLARKVFFETMGKTPSGPPRRARRPSRSARCCSIPISRT